MFLGIIKINNPLFLKLLKDDSIIDFLTSGISTSNTQILKIKSRFNLVPVNFFTSIRLISLPLILFLDKYSLIVILFLLNNRWVLFI